MQVELLSMAFLAIAVFVILVCYNLLWHNPKLFLHTICSEGKELKKRRFLQPDIKSLLFLGLFSRDIYLDNIYYS